MIQDLDSVLPRDRLHADGSGPLYLRLRQLLDEAITTGKLRHGDALPAERDIAVHADVSRVTVRKAVADLAMDGLVVRRRGSGTFVAKLVSRVEQSVSRLASFTEDMDRRGLTTRAEWLERDLCEPSPREMMVLGLAAGTRVARLARLRIAGGVPMAIERASLSEQFLPDPFAVEASLYAKLDETGSRPVRAVQRISATSLKEGDALLLETAVGAAGLSIERVSYLASGRVVEFTHSLYRGDAYDFVAELTTPHA